MSTIETLYARPSELDGAQPGTSAIVLLVDDQTTVAMAVRALLAEVLDISLHYCQDPTDAIRTANKIKPTVILQDLAMPSVDGLDLVALFRANPQTEQTPIIVLSSEENSQIKSRAFAVGANDYLVKLPDKSELIARIRYHSQAYLNLIQRDDASRSLLESEQQLIATNTRLEETHQKLNAALREAEQRTRETLELTELVDVLQSCQTMEEAYEMIKSILPAILSSQSGALCITGTSRNIVEAVAIWGDSPATAKAFVPENCWALRRGKPHVVKDSASPLWCPHVSGSSGICYVCVPLAAQGETLGVLYLEFPLGFATKESQESLEALSRKAIAACERISLALGNLRLREALRVQSVRDPLTGLFNRRYMEESLERELRRAGRSSQSVAVMILDIDRFKKTNDTFGHQAGDALLRALGELIRHGTRGQDVACRYGGEEFAIIMVGASIDAPCIRAERLREEIKALHIQHAGQTLGAVTFSIGISVFPVHAKSADQLIRIADQALYRAKREGRDRVIVGSESEE